MISSRDFQNPQDARYDEGGYFRSPRLELVPHIPPQARRLLDVGCAAGEFGKTLKSIRDIEVIGVELDPQAAEMARRHLDQVITGNIETLTLPFPDGYFDCITCADVLEHLVDPWNTLLKLKRLLAPEGTFVISLPNVSFFEILFACVQGFWTYTDHGILDRTHLRFFTPLEAQRMMENAELEVVTIEPLCGVSEDKLPRDSEGFVTLWGIRLGPLDDRQYLTLRTFQTLVIARTLPLEPFNAACQAFEKGDFMRAYRLAHLAKEEQIERRKMLLEETANRLGYTILPEEIYREYVECNPQNSEALAELAICLIMSNQTGQAKPWVQKARALDPENPLAVGATGLAALALAQYDTAFRLLADALERGRLVPALVDGFLDAAERLGRFSDAQELLERRGIKRFQHIAVLRRYAELLERHGEHDRAAEYAKRAAAISSYPEDAQQVIAKLHENTP